MEDATNTVNAMKVDPGVSKLAVVSSPGGTLVSTTGARDENHMESTPSTLIEAVILARANDGSWDPISPGCRV